MLITIINGGGFLPLILVGGGFCPLAIAVAGGVLLAADVSFYFTPAAFRLVYARERAPAMPHAMPPVPILQTAE
ncbi:hypothetical protein FIU94_08785 [Sulfitobacter sp. THAF37]|uniref:hypothetical protein n=1 Tax=Sulfitobacter sp. THAF37 TaxID=2587855 RepID=UPI0012689101|nr:hypothetical protein [Sulfitobacter sp. THAF37]QFT58919.1 hypothetical protein FIU94_08785 [Sulfitobacter sp. THAF37]